MRGSNTKFRKLVAFFVMAAMLFAVLPIRVSAAEEEYIRIDILHHADLHGMVDNFISGSDPGIARMAAFMEYWRSQNPNTGNVHLMAAGDNYHGHPVSNFLNGSPIVWLYEFMGVDYSALGNHEFSFGSVDQARYFGQSITFLAADLFMAGTNTRPDWVQPYTILQDGDAVVAVVGLMTSGLSHLVSQAILGGFDLRTPTIGASLVDGSISLAANHNAGWVQDIEELIEFLRDNYGADAVVALTHMGTGGGHGAEANVLAYLVDGFDAIIAGHTHLLTNNVVNHIPVAEAGWHGRNVGRLSFVFDTEGNLLDITSEMSGPANLDGAPNPNSVLNFHLNEAFQDEDIQAVYNTVSAMVDRFWDEAGVFLNRVVGTRGTPGAPLTVTDNTELRNHRNAWVTELVAYHITNNTNDADWANTVQNEWVYISNFGGWRNMGPWHWDSADEVTMLDMLATMPFNNAILLFEMEGRDLLTLLNMEASGSAVLDPPEFGLNGGQPVVVAGATRGDRIADFEFNGVTRPRYNWYLANGEQISDDGTIYRVAVSNFIWGGLNANGGDRFPFPGNNHGNALGMNFISQPVALLADGSLVPWPNVPTDSTLWEDFGLMLLRDAMIATLESRMFQNIEPMPMPVVDPIIPVEPVPIETEPADPVYPVPLEIPTDVVPPGPINQATVYNIGGVQFVRLIDVIVLYGASVYWQEGARIVTVTLADGTEIVFTTGYQSSFVNPDESRIFVTFDHAVSIFY